MERSIIESSVASLPISPLGIREAEVHEIWEERDSLLVGFKVTRHRLPTPDQQEFISLTIKGYPGERLRIAVEFSEVYGVPIAQDIRLESLHHMDALIWLVPNSEQSEI